MNRDHLLGCRQYIPDVENEPFTPVYRKLMSVRQEKELAEQWRKNRGFGERDPKLTAFESGDHTPTGVKSVKKPRVDDTWGLSWHDLNREYVDAVMLAPPRWVIDPTHVESVADLMQPYKIWEVAKAEPKSMTATEVMLKRSLAQQRINDVLYPPVSRFYGAQPEEWDLPPDEL